jgi:hypothetical protein
LDSFTAVDKIKVTVVDASSCFGIATNPAHRKASKAPMTPDLIFLFLFMSALAFAFAHFFAGIVFRDSPVRSIRRFRNGLALFALTFPWIAFFLYRASLPEGGEWITAFYPALWAAMVLFAMVLGMTVARWRG